MAVSAVRTLRYRMEPLVECERQRCELSPEATRQRVRQHVERTGHTVRVIVRDVTVYRREGDEA